MLRLRMGFPALKTEMFTPNSHKFFSFCWGTKSETFGCWGSVKTTTFWTSFWTKICQDALTILSIAGRPGSGSGMKCMLKKKTSSNDCCCGFWSWTLTTMWMIEQHQSWWICERFASQSSKPQANQSIYTIIHGHDWSLGTSMYGKPALNFPGDLVSTQKTNNLLQ